AAASAAVERRQASAPEAFVRGNAQRTWRAPHPAGCGSWTTRLSAFRFLLFSSFHFVARVERSETRGRHRSRTVAPGFRFAQSGLLLPGRSVTEPKALPPAPTARRDPRSGRAL